MAKGHEFLHRIHEALEEFEKVVVRREHKRPLLDSAVTLQQDVDRKRQQVVDTLVNLIKEAQEEYLPRK